MGVIRSLRTNLEASGATKYKGAMVRAAAATSRFAGAAGGATAAMGSLNAAAGAAAGGIAVLAGGAAIGAAVKSFADFDEAMVQSQAIMGDLSENTMAEMEQAALDVGSTTVASNRDAAKSYFFLASAGLDAKQSIEALPTVAQFAQAGMFSMAQATDLLTDAQSALGLSVDDATQNMQNMRRVANVLVKANQLANASVQQFSEALTNRAAAALRSANKSIEEGVAVLAAFADQGLKGRRAGTFLARVLRRLSKSAAENTEEFKQLGLITPAGNLEDMATIVEVLTNELRGLSDAEKSARLEQLGFTARIQAAIKPLLGTSEQLREYRRQTVRAGNAMQEVADRNIDTLNKEFGLLTDTIGAGAIELGKFVAETLNLKEGIRDLRTEINNVRTGGLRGLAEVGLPKLGLAGEALLAVLKDQTTWLDRTSDSMSTLDRMVRDILNPFEELPDLPAETASAMQDMNSEIEDTITLFSEFVNLRRRVVGPKTLIPGVGPSRLREMRMGRMGLAATAAMAGRGGVRMPATTRQQGLPSSEQVDNTEGLSNALKGLGINSKETWQALTNDLLPALTQLASRFGGVAAKIANFASQVLSSVAKILQSSALSFGGPGGLATLGAGLISGFAGFFQHGGGIPSGQFGVVGEAGPEIVQGPATVTPGGMTLQVDASGLPEPQTPFEVARDRQWLRLLSESNDVLRVNKGGL